ncbi:MAG: hypothetical protein KGD63_03165 [Candidatus Lokiarchaeota archaeon]|nr:hypothetical protein [Candidatus Lokiarchaeota archaeon]
MCSSLKINDFKNKEDSRSSISKSEINKIFKFLYILKNNYTFERSVKKQMSSEKTVYKINISAIDGESKGLSKKISLDGKKFNRLEGMKIGEILKGGLIGFPNYEFEITGGSDASGFPMRKDVHGPVKKRILFSKKGIGYAPVRKGEKKRRTVRGNEITSDMTLVNLKVIKYGEAELFTLIKEE